MPLSGNFTSQLKYWAGHAFFCATPSFILAYGAGFDSWSAVAAMLSAVALFVALYALVSSRRYFQIKIKPGLLGQAIHIGAKLRSTLSFLGLATFLTPALKLNVPIYPLMPDLYCGILAVQLTEFITNKMVYRMGTQEGFDTFWRTFLITTFDGVLLSGTLFVVVLLCLVAKRLKSKSCTAETLPA